MLCRTAVPEAVEFEDGRSGSDPEYDEADDEADDEDDDEVPGNGTCGGRDADEDMTEVDRHERMVSFI
jgi:hypothetical protein